MGHLQAHRSGRPPTSTVKCLHALMSPVIYPCADGGRRTCQQPVQMLRDSLRAFSSHAFWRASCCASKALALAAFCSRGDDDQQEEYDAIERFLLKAIGPPCPNEPLPDNLPLCHTGMYGSEPLPTRPHSNTERLPALHCARVPLSRVAREAHAFRSH